MVKVFGIPGTGVKIRISQDEELWLKIKFDSNSDYLLNPNHAPSAELIRALGFPTEPNEPSQPIDGGDLEEVTE